MMTVEPTDLFSLASLVLSAFGVAMCLSQERDQWLFRTFALVLLCSGLIDLSAFPWPIDNPIFRANVDVISALIWLIALLCLPPLFWHYICVLTSIPPSLPKRLWLHCALPCIGVFTACLVLAMPQDARFGLFVDGYDLPSGYFLAIGIAGEVLSLFALLQWGVYFVAIFRRLLRHRERVKEYFATTEKRELTWIWVLILFLAAYWITNALDTFLEIGTADGIFPQWIEDIIALALLSIVLLWGLRQRPAFTPDDPPQQPATKYENSALSQDMATRLERKLRNAMVQDKLHHDPNLSLWALAKHLGASPNYVSQTLNECIGENFFDFVNRYRIEEAQKLLSGSEDTVLDVALEVGFNSRSSFYSAFKKVTGQTPSAYRQAMSVPAE